MQGSIRKTPELTLERQIHAQDMHEVLLPKNSREGREIFSAGLRFPG
jgi:hypothetical protein